MGGQVRVPSDLRGRGYGSAMLDHVLDVARAHGRARMVHRQVELVRAL